MSHTMQTHDAKGRRISILNNADEEMPVCYGPGEVANPSKPPTIPTGHHNRSGSGSTFGACHSPDFAALPRSGTMSDTVRRPGTDDAQQRDMQTYSIPRENQPWPTTSSSSHFPRTKDAVFRDRSWEYVPSVPATPTVTPLAAPVTRPHPVTGVTGVRMDGPPSLLHFLKSPVQNGSRYDCLPPMKAREGILGEPQPCLAYQSPFQIKRGMSGWFGADRSVGAHSQYIQSLAQDPAPASRPRSGPMLDNQAQYSSSFYFPPHERRRSSAGSGVMAGLSSESSSLGSQLTDITPPDTPTDAAPAGPEMGFSDAERTLKHKARNAEAKASLDRNSESETPSTGKQQKIYPCPLGLCDSTFTTSGHSTRHKKVHSGEKSIQCDFPGCDKMFARRDNMRQHMRTHVRVKAGLQKSRTSVITATSATPTATTTITTTTMAVINASPTDSTSESASKSPEPTSRRGLDLLAMAAEEIAL